MIRHAIIHFGEFFLLSCNVGNLFLTITATSAISGIQIYGLLVSVVGSTFFLLNEWNKHKWRMEQRRQEKENKAKKEQTTE